MKKIIAIVLIVSLVSLMGCGDTKKIDGVEYDTFGLANESDKRNPNIEYRLVIGNLVWSAILVETIIAPIYFIGWSIYEPVKVANPNKVKGEV